MKIKKRKENENFEHTLKFFVKKTKLLNETNGQHRVYFLSSIHQRNTLGHARSRRSERVMRGFYRTDGNIRKEDKKTEGRKEGRKRGERGVKAREETRSGHAILTSTPLNHNTGGGGGAFHHYHLSQKISTSMFSILTNNF